MARKAGLGNALGREHLSGWDIYGNGVRVCILAWNDGGKWCVGVREDLRAAIGFCGARFALHLESSMLLW